MSRSLLGVSLVAILVSACSNSVPERRAARQTGSPNGSTPEGSMSADEEWDEEGAGEETPGGGGGSDGGVSDGGVSDGGGSGDGGVCVSRPTGWRAMASFPTSGQGAPFSMQHGRPVWTGSEALFVGSETYRTGCSTGGVCERTVMGAYNPSTNTWRNLPSPWPDKADFGLFSVWTGSTWLVYGGLILGTGSHEAFEWDPTTNAWTKLPLPPITPLQGQSMAWAPSTKELVFSGGIVIVPGSCSATTACEFEPTNEGAAWSAVTKTWRRIAPSPLSPRMNSEASWDGRRVVFAWGNAYCADDCEGTSALGGVAAYDPAADTWEMLPEAPIAPRMTSVLETLGAAGNLAAFGMGKPSTGDGDMFPVLHDGAAWDGTAGAWVTIRDPNLPGQFRDGHTSWSGGGRLFVWGGEGFHDQSPDSYRRYDDGAMWDPATQTWTTLPAGGLSPRSDAAAVWTGCEAIVYGGFAADLSLANQGKIFRP